MPPRENATIGLPLFVEHADLLDRYERLLDEDQALRAAEFEKPDPARRRLRVSCNDCRTPWCCNHRVDVDLLEAMAIYRWAAKHAPALLDAALQRARELRRRRTPYDLTDFFNRRIPCPFLVKGRCGIYPVRPHNCRTHYMAGNPLKCRDELQPSETYAMDPDPTVTAELRQAEADFLFFNLVDGVKVTELAESLLFVEALAKHEPDERPTHPRTLDWAALEGEQAASPPGTSTRTAGRRRR